MNMSSGNKKVDAIGEINFSGNVIPSLWFKNLKLESGKPDVIAILLLSEIVYWHRPTEQRDETTGQIVGKKKRFKAELLQRSYISFADQFGFSKRQVTDAIIRLEKIGLVKRHFKTVFVNGQANNNVLFIDVNPGMIRKITYENVTSSGGASPAQKGEGGRKSPSNKASGGASPAQKGEGYPESAPDQGNGGASHFQTGEGYPENGGAYHVSAGEPLTFKRGTNTEITTEITNIKDNPPPARADNAPAAKKNQDEQEQGQNQKPFTFTELPVDEDFKALVKLYDETFPGTFNDRVVKHLTIMLEKANLDLIEYAFDHATLSANQPLTLKFIVSILNRWLSKNIKTAEQARNLEQKRERETLDRQERKQQGGGGSYYGRPGRTEKLPEWFEQQKEEKQQQQREKDSLQEKDVAKQPEQAQNEPEAAPDEREHSPDFKALGMDEKEVLAILSYCRPGEQSAFYEMETDYQKQFLDIKKRAIGNK